jgi:O-antigen/teichoic acid export membrane protein
MPFWHMILTALNLVGARFGGAAIGLASQILLARLLSQDQVGVVFMGMSAAAIVSLLVTGGYPLLAITCLPRYYALGRTNLVTAFHAAFWRDTLVLSLIVFAAATGVILWLPVDEALKTALLFGCLSAPASALLRMNGATANSLRRYTLSYVPDFLFRPGLLLVYLMLAWLAGIPLSVTHVLWAFIIANTVVALGQAWLMGSAGAVPRFTAKLGRGLAPYLRGRAAALIIVAAVAGAFADTVTMIGGLFLAPDDVAVLGVAARLAALAGFIIQATQQFILPDLTVALARGTREQVKSLLFRINVVALGAIAACVIGALLVGDQALRIFGEGYARGHWTLVLLMISQVFRAASGMNQHLLSLDGHQVKTAGACLVALAVLVAGAAVLAPRFGVLGMGLAVIAADAVWAVLLAIQAERHAGYRGDIVAVLMNRR